MPMYGEERFDKLYARIVNADETQLLEPTAQLLELLCEAVFVEFPGWREPPPLVPLTLDNGVTYQAIEVGLKVSTTSLTAVYRDYDKIEFFAVKPSGTSLPSPIAFRKTHEGMVVVQPAVLRGLPTSVLQAMVGHIKVHCPAEYARAHNEFRQAVEKRENMLRYTPSAP